MLSIRAKAAASLVACAGFVTSASADIVIGLQSDNTLIAFRHSNPGSVSVLPAVTGLAAGETLLGIDQRALNGEIFVLGSSSRLYSVNLATGVATAPGPNFAPVLTPGVEYGFDFNPTVDRIRVVNAAGENRRLRPDTGAHVATDTMLTYVGLPGVTPRAVGTAYTNSQPGGVPVGSVRQLIIDSELDILGEVGSMAGGNPSFNGGMVTQLGSLGVDTNDLVGFDISGPSGLALVSLTDGLTNISSLYTINLTNGSTMLLGGIGNNLTIRDIAILVPAPGSALGLAMAGLVTLRRRR
jgi:hypothetical protein